MHWRSGTISGIFNVASTGTLYLDGITVIQYAALTNAGHIVWNGSGNWQTYNDTGLDGTINNLSGATIDIECNQSLYPPNGNQVAWLNNAGLLRKSLSSGNSSITVTFTNSSTVEVLSGSLSFGFGSFWRPVPGGHGTGLDFGNGGILSGTFIAGEEAVVDFYGGAFTQTPRFPRRTGSYLLTGSSTLPCSITSFQTFKWRAAPSFSS